MAAGRIPLTAARQHAEAAQRLMDEVGEWLAGNGDIPASEGSPPAQTALVMATLARGHIEMAELLLKAGT